MAVSVQCPNCRAKLSLKSEAALGKKVACPKCKKPFKAETSADEDPLDFLDDSSIEDDSPPEDEDEDQEPEEREEPRRGRKSGGKKSRKSSFNPLPLILGIVGVAVVLGGLVGVGFLVWNLMNAKKPGLDLAWIPADSQAVMHARVGEVLDSGFVKSLVKDADMQTLKTEMQKNLGVAPSDIVSITVGIQKLEPGNPAGFAAVPLMGVNGAGAAPKATAVIRSKVPLDQTKIFEQLKLTENQTEAGKSYRSSGLRAAYFASPTMLVLSDTEQLKRLIANNGAAADRPEFDFVDIRPHIILAAIAPPKASTGAPSTMPPPGAPGMPGMPGGSASNPMDKAKAVALGLTAGTDLDVSVQFNCADATTTKALKEEVDTKIAEGKQQITQSKQNPLMGAMLGPVFDVAETVMKSVQTSSSGETVLLTAKVPASIKSSVEHLMSSPMFAGAGPFGGPGGMPGGVPQAAPESLGGFPASPPGALPPGAGPPGLPPGAPIPGGAPPTTLPAGLPMPAADTGAAPVTAPATNLPTP